MRTAKFTLDPADPPKLSSALEARQASITPEEIEANAASDTDNPPLTEAELDRMSAASLAKEARATVGLSQARFAKAFRINPARLRDLEQGRHATPDSALVAYLTVIRREPEAVSQALAEGRS